MRTSAVIAFAFCLASLTVFAAEPPSVAADSRVADAVAAWSAWVEYQLAVDDVPGASVAVVHDQEVLLARGMGIADSASGRTAASDTQYSICSISKLFTAIAVMQLRDEGKLRLDEPVASYLDWYAIEDVHPDDEPVTLRRILTHSSGLPRESDFPYWSAPDYDFPSHQQIVDRLAEQQTLYPSGRYFQYSNLGLTLAGETVAAVSGQAYGEAIRQRILDPLQMTDTFTDIPAQEQGSRMALGHSERNRAGPRDRMPGFTAEGIAPAAGFASTVEDLSRFASWQFRLLGDGAEAELLRPATLREMQRVHWIDPDWETTWGLGFAVSRSDDHSVVSHSGGCPGYYSRFLLDPKAKVAVIVLTNAIGADVGLYTTKGLELIRPAIAQALEGKDEAPQRDPELDRYVGIYHSDWGESAILRWKDGLADLWLGARDPAESLTKLERVEDHVFRHVRDDDESAGETYVFEIGPDGTATRFLQHSNWMVRVEE